MYRKRMPNSRDGQDAFLEKVISLTEDLYLLEDVNISRVNSIASRHIKHVIANADMDATAMLSHLRRFVCVTSSMP